MGIHVPQNIFDHRNPNYISRSLFCRESHCFHETKKIGFVFSVWLIFACLLEVGYCIYKQEFPLEVFLQILPVVSIILLFLGLKVKSSGLLLPFLLFLGLQIVLFILLEIALILGLCSSTTTVLNLIQEVTNDSNAKKFVKGFEEKPVEMNICMSVAVFVVLLLFSTTVWSFLAVQRCGIYLRDLKQFKKRQGTVQEDAL